MELTSLTHFVNLILKKTLIKFFVRELIAF